jgi:methionyl-tRNA formyltransferase
MFAEEGIDVVCVLTNPDSPRGRSGKNMPTDVCLATEKFAERTVILKPGKLDSQARDKISSLKPDLLVSFAYGKIFGPKFLSLFPLGGINVHPSLLPKYRGPSPIQAAILNRDLETGISVQKLAAKMDTGDILAQKKLQLTGTETAGSLGGVMARLAAELLPGIIMEIAAGENAGTAQNHSLASYCALIDADDGTIDWNKSVNEIEAMIRAYNPWPLCRTMHEGKKLYILKAAIKEPGEREAGREAGRVLGIDKKLGILVQTGSGILAVSELQYQAKKALGWRDFINGARNFTDAILG